MNLRIPGPIPVPEEILGAMSEPMINHRGPEFKEILYRTTERIKKVFETNNDVYIITASGTGAMEASIVNTLSPRDKVLCVTVGEFGNRFGEIAEVYGAEVTTLAFPYGTAVDLDKLRESLAAETDFKAVLVTHNETSTGVTIDLEAVAGVVKASPMRCCWWTASAACALFPCAPTRGGATSWRPRRRKAGCFRPASLSSALARRPGRPTPTRGCPGSTSTCPRTGAISR